MRNVLLLGCMLVITGCASQSIDKKSPPINRISAEELARIVPQPIATLSLDDLVKLSHEGATAEQIIEKITQTNSVYDLSPSQSIELHRRGVDNQVLDYVHTSRERAVMNSISDEINKREKSKRDALEKLKQQQLQELRSRDSYCGYSAYGIHPFGYSGYYGSRFGMGFGWPLGCW